MKVSQVWMGYGSAIFIDFGELRPKVRLNGKLAHHPYGELTLFACWGWRIEGKRRIWCGSWSEKERLEKYVKVLEGKHVISASLTGRLGEIALNFSNGLGFQSFMSEQGDPDWSLRSRDGVHLTIVAGRLFLDRRDEAKS
jgi:hypothetical protein